jgi:hypothetical protein
VELRSPCINGVDANGSVLEHAIGKSACRRADIQHGHSRGIDPEPLQRVRQFLPTARNEARTGAQYDLLIAPQLLPRRRTAVRRWQRHIPRHYERTSLLDASHKALIDHQLIESEPSSGTQAATCLMIPGRSSILDVGIEDL